jgi:DNA (cytosine-5)-methyltransferase 1
VKALRVVDLFCGPGGISEGLRQAALVPVYALDKDRAATDTFAKNHPDATVVRLDVTGFEPDHLPDFEVLVGGPPCIEFSNSKGSKGNILEGLRLVQEFLRIVYERSPRYWIMENVPRIVLHLPEEIPLRWIGVDKAGSLHVPMRAQFDCADFGVPQAPIAGPTPMLTTIALHQKPRWLLRQFSVARTMPAVATSCSNRPCSIVSGVDCAS